jgi:ankyrin repeat protein
VETSIVNRYYDPTTDQFLSIDPDVATTDQPYVFTNDDPLNGADPLGLYNCSGKSPSHIAARYRRGDQAINLVCGVGNSPGQTGYGVVHIQVDGKHFGGDLSDLALREIGVTIKRGEQVDRRGATVAYVQKFQVTSNSDNLPEAETFTVRVVVDNQHGRVTTARIEEPIVDQNPFDGCHFAGINLC